MIAIDQPGQETGVWEFCERITAHCRQRQPPGPRRAFVVALIPTAALSCALFFYVNTEIAMASNDLAGLKEKLRQLRTATNIVLLIVPYPASFRVRVDEAQLPKVSCVYEIASGQGPTFDHVLDIIGTAAIEYDAGPKLGADLRIGIIFKRDGEVIQDFYFDDWGGHHQVRGFSDSHRMMASADLPNQLRALLTQQDVILVRNNDLPCPHP
jgi:hypothetical protein